MSSAPPMSSAHSSATPRLERARDRLAGNAPRSPVAPASAGPSSAAGEEVVSGVDVTDARSLVDAVCRRYSQDADAIQGPDPQEHGAHDVLLGDEVPREVGRG